MKQGIHEAGAIPLEEAEEVKQKRKYDKGYVRDEDGFRVPTKRTKDDVTYVQKNAELASGIVADVFTKNGMSWWRDEHGMIRRLKKYETPEQLIEAIEDWEANVLDKLNKGVNIIPDAEALAVGLDISRNTLMIWAKGDRGKDYEEIISTELNKIAMVKNQLAMNGAIPPLVWTVMMNNNHGYVQKQDTQVDITLKREPMKADELISQANILPM